MYPNKAAFLDRDGVLIRDDNYVYEKNKVVFLEKVFEAVKILNQFNYKVIIISNQAGVARGYFEEKDVKILHEFLQKEFSNRGAIIDKFYFCPHHPDAGHSSYTRKCLCRKPNPGLINQAIKDFNINPRDSFIVGDKWSDIGAGINANLGYAYKLKEASNNKEIGRAHV